MTPRSLAAALVLVSSTAAGQVSGPAGGPASTGGEGADLEEGAAPGPSGRAAPGPAASPRGAMVHLPGGFFRAAARVGPLEDTPVYHRVSSFLLDAAEVTVAEYAACVTAGGCTPAATTVRGFGLAAPEQARWSRACNGDQADRADHPVNCVDWFQAEAYCAWAGKRLPTEAEWEWAARGGGAGTRYPWGDAPPAEHACWSGTDGPRTGTCPAGALPAGGTPSGLQDLAGNVWEWTSTRDVIFTDSRGRGGASARIVRGGGWADTDPGALTAGRRGKDTPDTRGSDVGFRCARSR